MQGTRRTGVIVAVVLTLLAPVGLRAQSTASGKDAASVTRAQALAEAETNRSIVIRDTVDRWRSQFRPFDPSRNIGGEEALLTAALQTASAEKLLAASQAPTYEDALAAVQGRWQGPSVIPLEAGPIPNTLGSVTTDLVFTPVTPCRIIDTRTATGAYAGPIGPNLGKYYYVTGSSYTAQGGNATTCGIPSSPKPAAVALNIASTAQGGLGNLKIVPTGGGNPPAVLMNYQPGVNLSNAAVVAVAQGAATEEAWIYSGNSTSQVIVDIMGYYTAPVATALSCTTVTADSGTIAAGTLNNTIATCPAGYTVTGGGFWVGAGFSPAVFTFNSSPSGNGWEAGVVNTQAGGIDNTVYAVCCRVPGR
jgi:hypothetical protein